MKNYKILTLLASVFLISGVFILNNNFGIINFPASKTLQVQRGNLLSASRQLAILDSAQSWNILDKLVEKDDELAKIPVSIGSREINYYEDRISFLKDDTKSINRVRFSDKERVLGLKLLNTKTGEIKIIKVNTKITPERVSVVAPDGYQIEIVERPNGIRWNLWNTSYRVVLPENTVVIKNLWPREETVSVTKVVNGKPKKETKKVVVGFPYVPHSEYFEQGEARNNLVKAGKEYEKEIVAKAFATLRQRGVMSQAFPNELVADVGALLPKFFERLPLLEQGDLTEFFLEPQKTAERVLIILGANQENSWIQTCNSSSACGWVQFTPKTYGNIRRDFSKAQLIINFKEGAGDHVNSMMAAILLHDSNLAGLVKRYGKNIAKDPRLEEYLAATYNGAPIHVWNSLDATLGKTVDDWTKHLRKETHGFIYKLRYLIENNLP